MWIWWAWYLSFFCFKPTALEPHQFLNIRESNILPQKIIVHTLKTFIEDFFWKTRFSYGQNSVTQTPAILSGQLQLPVHDVLRDPWAQGTKVSRNKALRTQQQWGTQVPLLLCSLWIATSLVFSHLPWLCLFVTVPFSFRFSLCCFSTGVAIISQKG